MDEGLDLDVRLTRGDFRLSVCQTIPAHGITAISGPSGSGKTSLLRVIAGLEAHAMGLVRLAGQVWQDDRTFMSPHKRRIGMVFQEPRLFPHLDVRANLLYGAARNRIGWNEVLPIVKAFDIEELLHRESRGLSGGEQRRVALARALAMRPRLLCLDEPLTGLDEARKADLLPYLARAVSQVGCPTLYVSHHGDEIAALADRVMQIAKGALVGDGLSPVRDCHDLPVVAATGGQLQFELGGGRIFCVGEGRVGQMRRLHIPASACLVSRNDPGPTSSAATLQGRITRIDTATQRVVIDVSGHPFDLPLDRHTCKRLSLSLGDPVFVQPLGITLMPDRNSTG